MRHAGWLGLGLVVIACGGADPRGPSGSSAPEASVAPPAAPDASPPEAPVAPPSCARAEQARTAPVSLFDAFQKDLASPSGHDRAARVSKLLADVAAQGGTPLEDPASDRVVFLVRGTPPSGVWSAVGSFAGWDKAKAVTLAAVDGTDLYWGETKIPRGTSHAYKLLSGTSDAGFIQDRLVHNVVWDGINRGTVGEFNAVVHPQDLPANAGRIEYRGTAHATKLADDRDIFVYLPARYDAPSCPRLPVVLFQDGNEALTRGDFAAVADGLYADRPDLAAVLVFVALPTQDVRMAQYTFGAGTSGDDYVDFLVSDLLPAMSTRYRLCANREARGISGASLGGLISTYAAFQVPSAFGWVGAQSASYFWADDALVTRVQTSPKIPTRFYLDSGAPDGACGAPDNCAVTDEMEQAMKQKGYDVLRVKANAAEHDWPFWSERLGGMLTHFRDGQSACD